MDESISSNYNGNGVRKERRLVVDNWRPQLYRVYYPPTIGDSNYTGSIIRRRLAAAIIPDQLSADGWRQQLYRVYYPPTIGDSNYTASIIRRRLAEKYFIRFFVTRFVILNFKNYVYI
jgi:hypothetical protein